MLELESAANYAFYRMSHADEPWRTDSLKHIVHNNHISFFISHKQDGAFARLTAFNKDSSRSLSVITGYIPSHRPALVVTASQTSISIVGDAQIKGGTAVRSGSVSYSSHYKMRAHKNAFYDTVFSGENHSYYDTLSFFPELSRRSFDNIVQKHFQNKSCILDGTDVINGELNCELVIFQGDSKCNKCRIQADRIYIRERSSLIKTNVVARTISLTENSRVDGTFFARDTIVVNQTLKQTGKVNLILQGHRETETNYVGKISLLKFKANNSAVIFLGDNWDDTLRGISVEVTDQVNFRGTLIANGIVDFRGKLQGYMTVSTFGFYDGITYWPGFLKDGQITGDTTVKVLLPDIVHFGGEPSYE